MLLNYDSLQYHFEPRNCFEGFEQLIKDKKQFRLIFCDLPYGLTQNQFDRNKFDLKLLWSYLVQLISPKGTILFFGAQPFTTELVNARPDYFRYELIWVKEKGTQFFNSAFRPLPIHESILVFSPEFPNKYNIVKTTGAKAYKKRKTAESSNYNGDSKNKVITHSMGERFPTTLFKPEYSEADNIDSVLEIARDRNQKYNINPTQKPVKLFRDLIKMYSDPGEWVLDICGGSFSSVIASMLEGVNCSVYESDAEQFDLSFKRVQYFIQKGHDGFKKVKKRKKGQKAINDYLQIKK